MPLADELADWTDWDVAAFSLGRVLGLSAGQDFHAVKSVFWTGNPLGNGLHDALLAPVSAQVLATRQEESDEQFRWHSTTT